MSPTPTAEATSRQPPSPVVQPAGPPAFRRPIASWALRLHGVDPDEVGRLDVDLAVVDIVSDGMAAGTYDPAAVRRMRARSRDGQVDGQGDGNGRKWVIAYLSIGEAESYRDYWRPEWDRPDGKPSWLGEANLDWEENYKVRYWEAGWQRVLFGEPGASLDRIVAAGFDGVFLDIVDAFEAYEESRPTARADMIALVSALAAHARRVRPDFLVVVQNGEALLTSQTYRSVLSAVAKEDLYYGTLADERLNAAQATAKSLEYLALARRDGIGVLVLEYLEDAGKIARVRRELAVHGDVLCVAEPDEAVRND